LRKNSSDEEEKKPENPIPKKLDPVQLNQTEEAVKPSTVLQAVAQNEPENAQAFKNSLEAMLANKGPNPFLRKKTVVVKEEEVVKEKIKVNVFNDDEDEEST